MHIAGTRVLVVWSLLAPPGNPGIGMVGGTSVGTPQWAAIEALGDQAAGHRLGLLNKALYRGGNGDDNEHAAAGAFHDITSGTNSIGPVTGFAAAPGWDAVTGLGAPNVANLMRWVRKSED